MSDYRLRHTSPALGRGAVIGAEPRGETGGTEPMPFTVRFSPQGPFRAEEMINSEYFALLGVFMHFWGKIEFCLAARLLEKRPDIENDEIFQESLHTLDAQIADSQTELDGLENEIKNRLFIDWWHGVLIKGRVSARQQLSSLGFNPQNQPYRDVLDLRNTFAHNAVSFWKNPGPNQNKPGLFRRKPVRGFKDIKSVLGKATAWLTRKTTATWDDFSSEHPDLNYGKSLQAKLGLIKYYGETAGSPITDSEVFGSLSTIYEPYTKKDILAHIEKALEIIIKLRYDPNSDQVLQLLQVNEPDLLPEKWRL